jgi:hypothetical protein
MTSAPERPDAAKGDQKIGRHGLACGIRVVRFLGEQASWKMVELRQRSSRYRPSLWPLLAVTFIMVGMIDVATHLRHW